MRLWGRHPTQNQVIAGHMQNFFRSLRKDEQPEQVAKKYAAYFWDRDAETLRDIRSLTKHEFDVSLGLRGTDLTAITKRVSLISDTLLLHDGTGGAYHEIGQTGIHWNDPERRSGNKPRLPPGTPPDLPASMLHMAAVREPRENWREDYFGIRTLDLAQLGTWILQARPLLQAGLTWYLPDYCLRTQQVKKGRPVQRSRSIRDARAVDFLLRGRRAIEASGEEPVKSRLVRPILDIKLPYIDGVGLRDFSRITVEEFGSYDRFRTYLRGKFLQLDEAQDAVQSEVALTRIGLEIREQIQECQAEMARIQRTRALAATGAVLGTTGATLTAVYGPALTAALGVLGATGGIWSVVQAISQNSVRTLREGRWYYIWTLDQAYEQKRAKGGTPQRSKKRR
ncbi:hypothetical protein AB0J71_38435 [Nonomuraea sp. NPDC049637]|uniref:hypothetical protein n=1 Tax=Nonomuraea sp. NPDC049637 TaxID=3154356 RepID=UPI003437E045